MWNLKSPDTKGTRGHLDLLFPSDADPIIVADSEKDLIEKLYAEYQVGLGRPNSVLLAENLRTEVRQALHDAYSEIQKNGKLAPLRDFLKLLAEECPYCGFGPIQDLDHHLPKAKYKALSVFPLNLIPCCTTCNRGKPRGTSHNPEAHLLNVYLEDVSQFLFFEAAVKIDAGTGGLQVTFQVSQPSGMSDELFARLRKHLIDYKLNEVYPAQVNIYLGEQQVSLEMQYEMAGGDGLRAYLQRSAVATSKRFGKNDWRAALLRGLSSCTEFCDGGFAAALGYAESQREAALKAAQAAANIIETTDD